MKKRLQKALGAVLGLSVALASSCADTEPAGSDPETNSASSSTSGPGGGPVGWNEGGSAATCDVDELLEAGTYGAKAKTLLTGLPLSESEWSDLQGNPDALPQLIDTWLELPESDQLLTRFFMTAMQQNGVTRENFLNLLGRNDTSTGRFRGPQLPQGYPNSASAQLDFMFRRSMTESMARTALELVRANKSLKEIATTKTYMLNTALISLLALMDDNVIGDDKKETLRTSAGVFDTIRLVSNAEDAPPASEALNPKSPNFGVFYHPNLRNINLQACGLSTLPKQISVTLQPPTTGEWRVNSKNHTFNVFMAFALGRIERFVMHATPNCFIPASTQSIVLYDFEDFFDWRMVDIRKPGDSENPTLFFDLAAIRTATEIVLHTPRLGFITHPGFLGTWMTNEDNGARVTANQALIVALGNSFESAAIEDYDPTNVDNEHAGDADCYGCHQTLDPMRDLVRGSFSNYYGEQLDPARQDMESDFYFGGQKATGSGIEFFVEQIAKHPMFAKAWVQKLCYFANAGPCPESDELERVVKVFEDSDFNFLTLVKELFSSPLVTGAKCLPGVPAGTGATISRRSHFCAVLANRAGAKDICAQDTEVQAQSPLQSNVSAAVESVPDDSYSRDEVKPVTIAETGMFVRANREAACMALAFNSLQVDHLFKGYSNPATPAEVEQGVTLLVEKLMGVVPSDPRYAAAKQVIRDHVDEVTTYVPAGQTVPLGSLIGLMSAVPIACMSPTVAGIGF
jgi:hypothetical protein